MEVNLSYDQIAAKLLHDNFLLTALELHLELIEAGKELTRLKEYFSNPGNFERQAARPGDLATTIARSHSQATLDSLDISRLSEDDGEKGAVDERVAVLEFELRRARECISALRANLTEAAATSDSDVVTSPCSDQGPSSETLKGHEQRALNFLVNEYLLRQGYRLTAVTFSEENGDQDFDDWDDVGLNVPRPPELPRLYREAYVRGIGPRPTNSCESQTEGEGHDQELLRLKGECESLHAELEKERMNNLEAQKRLPEERKISQASAASVVSVEGSWTKDAGTDAEEQGSGSSGGITDHFEMVEQPPVVAESGWTKIESEQSEEISSPEKYITEEAMSNISREIPDLFKNELYSLLNSLKPKHILSQEVDILSQLSELLPKILQSLPSNRKEDLIPLISLTARLHPDPDQAAKLISLLLTLRKRPQENERKAIVDGLCDLAENQNLVESQLLPQIWDLAGVKTVEKRLLAAEICSALAPITTNHIRKSQLLPLLQQLMVEASEEEVKISVVQNLSIVIIYISDCDKYLQCEELCFLALKDNSNNVQACTIQLLLPVVAQWALQINKLETHLLSRLISRLRALSKDLRSIQLINALLTTLPFLLLYVGNCETVYKKIDNSILRSELLPIFQSLSNPEYFYNGQHKSIDIINGLNSCLNEEWYPMWRELEWVINIFLPELYEILCSLDISNEEIVIAFVKLYHFICKGFGKNFTTQKIKPLFKEGLKNLEESVSNLGAGQDNKETQASLMVIPVLLVSILTTGDPNDTLELSDTLRHLLVSLPVCNLPTFPLKVSLSHLCRAAALQEVVLSALSDASRHSRPVVRLCAAQLTLPCLGTLQEALMIKYVLPMLSMLANDNDGEVREATVALFAELIATSKCKEAQMQSRAALQAFLKDSPANVSHTMSLALTRALTRIIPSCDPAFREDVMLPHLSHLVTHCQHANASQTRRMDLGLALVSAVSAATQSPLSKQAMASYLVPALRSLEAVTGACMSAHHDAVSSWLREAESRCHMTSAPSTPTPTTPADRSVPGSQLMQSAMSSASAVGRRSVEDVKQKVSSLLRKK